MKTLVKKSASIGANATIICGNNIGSYSLIGAGSVVTKNVPDYAMVLGNNPAKIVRWIDERGNELVFNKKLISECGNFKFKNGIVVRNAEFNGE